MHLQRLTHFSVLFSLVLLCESQLVAREQLVHQYAPITWVENLAIRPNGKILPITTTSPLLNELDPATGTLRLVHDFADYGNAIQGITEITPDAFTLNVLTCTIATNLSCTPGSLSTWLLDFCDYGSWDDMPRIRQLATFPNAGFLNGMAALNSNTVLMADSFLGGIWSLNIYTGIKKLVFTDSSMNGTATVATGINGIRVRPGWLYFTNSAKGTFNRIAIDLKTGEKAGQSETISSSLSGPDDFEIDDDTGEAYVCNGAADEILRITLNGGRKRAIAKLPGLTSARWNVDQNGKVLYVSDVGGLAQYVKHNVTLGGAIYRIDL